tara:strand:- start:670 stop:849 length:180 start_codon:yes stop_codon:yes gene_type:complete
MKTLKLLNKKKLLIVLLFSLVGFGSHSQEPVDIWSVEKKSKIKDEAVNTNSEKKKEKKK